MTEPGPAIETGRKGIAFADELLHCIAQLCAGGPLEGSLGLCFGLSAWMKRYGVGLDETVEVILRLRSALVSVSGLDEASEPVPLRVTDRAVFVLNLAVYVEGLLRRAAGVLGITPREAADAAVGLLRSH